MNAISRVVPLIRTGRGRAIAVAVVALLVVLPVVASRAATPAAADRRVVTVERGTISQTVTISGAVDAGTAVRLNFRTPGKLADVAVTVGRRVAAGDVIARLEQTDLLAAAGQAQAALAQAQSRYDVLVAGATGEDVRIARQASENAGRSLEAAQRSADADVATAQQGLVRVQTNLRSARATLALAIADVRDPQSDLGAVIAQLETARTDLNSNVNAAGGNTFAAQIAPPSQTVTDGKTAQASLAVAAAQLATADAYVKAIPQATADAGAAADAIVDIATRFDAAAQQGDDTAALDATYQSQLALYSSAAARLASLQGSTNAALLAAEAALASAQGSLANAAGRGDLTYDTVRTELAALQQTLIGAADRATTRSAKLGQAGTAVATISDAVIGSYLAALQGLASAQARANASVVAARNALDSANAALARTVAAPRDSDLASATAAVQAASAALDAARANLDGSTLRSPTSGVVAAVNAKAGELVASNPLGLVVIQDIGRLVLHGVVGEADVQRLRLDQPATVSIGGATLKGRVTSIDPAATIQAGVPLFGVEVTIDAPGDGVRPGMSGTASVAVATKSDVLTVPTVAVRTENGRRSVQVLRNGQPVAVDVTVGLVTDTLTEVVSGLSAGDQVLAP